METLVIGGITHMMCSVRLQGMIIRHHHVRHFSVYLSFFFSLFVIEI